MVVLPEYLRVKAAGIRLADCLMLQVQSTRMLSIAVREREAARA